MSKRNFFQACLFVASLFVSVMVSAQVVITEALVISESDGTYDNQDVVVDGVEVVFDGYHELSSLSLINGAVLTHSVESRINIKVDGLVHIDAQSVIDVGEKGLLPAEDVVCCGVSGSHGGKGGSYPQAHYDKDLHVYYPSKPQPSYGRYDQPDSLGGGAIQTTSNEDEEQYAMRGGGRIKIVAKTIDLYGRISANGRRSNYAGAGGSIWLDAETVNIMAEFESCWRCASISADGSDGVGGSGGGRIAIYFNSYSYDPDHFSVKGGNESNNFRAESGGSGTLYLYSKAEEKGELIISGGTGWNTAPNTIVDVEPNTINAIEVRGGGALIVKDFESLLDGEVLNVNVSLVDGGSLIFDEDVTVGRALDQSNVESAGLGVEPTFNVKSGKLVVNGRFTTNRSLLLGELEANDLIVNEESTFLKSVTVNNIILNQPLLPTADAPKLTVIDSIITPDNSLTVDGYIFEIGGSFQFQSLELINEAVLTTVLANESDYKSIELIVLDMLIDETSAVDVSNKGFFPSDVDLSVQGFTCDNHFSPQCPGGGSGYESDPKYGGGAIKLTVHNLTLNGEISSASTDSYSGAGAIWLDVNNLISGSDTAKIVAGSVYGDGGSLAIYYESNDGFDFTNIDVNPAQGDEYTLSGAAGTVYIENRSTGERSLKIQGGGGAQYQSPRSLSDLDSGLKVIVDSANVDFSESYQGGVWSVANGSLITFHQISDLSEFSGFLISDSEFAFQGGISLPTNLPFLGQAFIITANAGVQFENNQVNVDGYTLSLNGAHYLDSVQILNEGVITSQSYDDVGVLFISANNIYIDQNSSIDLTGKGRSQQVGDNRKVGGSHGGLGGNYTYKGEEPIAPLSTYGDKFQPSSPGSGGYEGTGGGVLNLSAINFELAGQLVADGRTYVSSYGWTRGGSAGGSILLDVENFTVSSDSAVITAKGSDADGYGGGGGGRIALYYDNLTENDPLVTDVSGGVATGGDSYSAYGDGEAGTAHIKQKALGPYVLGVDLEAVETNLTQSVSVQFSEAIDTGSISVSDLKLRSLADESVVIYPELVTYPSDDTSIFEFSELIPDASYRLILEPNVTNISGVPLDQNQNKVSGEIPQDRYQFEFVLDTVAPLAPVINSYPSETGNRDIVLSGNKEIDSTLIINGSEYSDADGESSWSHEVRLYPGENVYTFLLVDDAGNESESVVVTITYDSSLGSTVPPKSVDKVHWIHGDGTRVVLDWGLYRPEQNENNIANYQVYYSDQPFSTQGSATGTVTVAAGVESFELSDLAPYSTVYVVVVAVDSQGLMSEFYEAIPIVLVDGEVPGTVQGLQVTSFETRIRLSWLPSDDAFSNLTHYDVVVDSGGNHQTIEVSPDDVENGRLSIDVEGLDPATAYPLEVRAVNDRGNFAESARNLGVTLLSNPTDITVSGNFALSWAASQPSELVDFYTIYASEQNFTNVDSLSPLQRVDVSEPDKRSYSVSLSSLERDTHYYLTVVATNLSDGSSSVISVVSYIWESDSSHPSIDSIQFDQGGGIKDIFTAPEITGQGSLTVRVSDESGIAYVHIYLNDVLIGNLVPSLTFDAEVTLPLDVYNLTDGAHSLTIEVFDKSGNSYAQSYDFSILLAAPEPPLLSFPSESITNKERVLIYGLTAPRANVRFTVNQLQSSEVVTADHEGKFSQFVELAEGINSITAEASFAQRSLWSMPSAAIMITRDNSIPNSPARLQGIAVSSGGVRLTWDHAGGAVGYNVYRSAGGLVDVAAEYKINPNVVVPKELVDTVSDEGIYQYAVTALNEAGTESSLSNIVEVTVDSSGPVATQIEYDFQGVPTGDLLTFSQGQLGVRVTFDEPLRNDPYLAYRASGAVLPVVVDLTQDYQDSTVYEGVVSIDRGVASGTYYAVMSAYDAAGNRGTQILAGEVIQIDTSGPDALSFDVEPGEPIKIDNSQDVKVSFRTSEAVAQGSTPVVVPLIDGVVMPDYAHGIELSLNADTGLWSGILTLKAAELLPVESVATLSFTYLAKDDFNNNSSRIDGKSSFQIYEGELPPANIPQGLKAISKPEGRVSLNWKLEPEASGYVVYRKLLGSATFNKVSTPSETKFIDLPPQDGKYQYVVSSVRMENEQQTESAQSEPAVAYSDRIPPGTPTGLELTLTGGGVLATWNGANIDPVQPEPDKTRHRLYRISDGMSGTPILAELTPIIDNIVGFIALDESPANDEHTYLVSAIDHAGNESDASNLEYLNIDLLPVSNFSVAISNAGSARLGWSHGGDTITHFNVSRKVGDVVTDLGPVNYQQQVDEFLDVGFHYQAGPLEVQYGVAAVDSNGVISLANTLSIPQLDISPVNPDIKLSRGVFNKVTFKMTNLGDQPLSNLQLAVDVDVDGEVKSHISETVSLSAGESKPVSVMVGGYAKLEDEEALSVRAIYHPSLLSSISIEHVYNAMVVSDALRFSFNVDELIRGGTASVSFTLENTSETEVELLMAQSDGLSASDDISLSLEDAAGNVLSEKQAHQYTGDVINVSSGYIVARVAPGGSFTSEAIDLPIPLAAPEDIKLRLSVERYRLNAGKDNELSIEGAGLVKTFRLIDAAYSAQVDSVTPEQVYGDQSVKVSGYAYSGTTANRLPTVPVKLVFSVRGFEEQAVVFTDSSGKFQYEYQNDGASGVYTVSALHPDITTRPNHGGFVVVGASAWPKEARVTIPRNYEQTVPLEVTASAGAVIRNVRLRLLPAIGQDAPELPAGVSLSHYPIEEIPEGETRFLDIKMYGDNSAADTGTIRFAVEADNFNGSNAIGYLTLDYRLSAARPSIVASPFYIDTGVVLGGEITEMLQIKNMGAQTLRNASVSLMAKNNAAVPEWVRVVSTPTLGDIAPNAQKQVQIKLAPPELSQVGNYEFYLKVVGDNSDTQEFPVFVTVTDSRTGDAFFHAADIYTATLNADGQLIEGLAGAKISLQNEQVLSETFDLTTNALGEALFEGVPAGRYSYRASAFDHDSVSGRVWVKPGVTATEHLFLQNSLINVQWSVTEIPIEDRYEITLAATYKTNVPAAVVLLEPLSINLPVMEKGQVYQGELVLTNYGLIRAINVQSKINFPEHIMKIEFLRDAPSSLEAGERIVLPYRIEAVRDFDVDAQDLVTGAGCGGVSGGVNVNYQYECANESVASGSAKTSVNSNWGGSGSACGGRSDYRGSGGGNGGGIGGPGGYRPSEPSDSYWCRVVTECDDGNCDNTSAK